MISHGLEPLNVSIPSLLSSVAGYDISAAASFAFWRKCNAKSATVSPTLELASATGENLVTSGMVHVVSSSTLPAYPAGLDEYETDVPVPSSWSVDVMLLDPGTTLESTSFSAV